MTCNKHYQFKDKRILSWLIVILVVFFIPLSTIAATTAEQNIQVTATVPSDVAKKHSCHCSKINTNETLTDPVNHWIILEVCTRDKNKNPLANKKVEVRTNRGSIDIFEYVVEIDGQLISQQAKTGLTNAQGKAFFKISSWTPGEATINIIVDNIVELCPITVTFLPLPFPTDVTIGVKVPGIEKELILYAPTEATEEETGKLSEEKKEAKKLANTGTKIDLPFWPLLIIAILIILIPVLLIWNFVNLRRVKNLERKEVELLEKIANKQDPQ